MPVKDKAIFLARHLMEFSSYQNFHFNRGREIGGAVNGGTFQSQEKISKIPLQYLQELIDFADFLIAKEKKSSANVRKSCFGAMKNKITYIAPDFDAPIEDFAEYM